MSAATMLQEIFCLLALILLTLCCQAVAVGSDSGASRSRSARQPSIPPNIIFVISDDIGFPDIGYNGGAGQGLYTPVMDNLAEQGIKLENYYAQFLCTPSRAALMTGRYPIHTGFQHFIVQGPEPRGLPLNLILLPEQLKTKGYDTHMIGKWHLGMYQEEYLPQNRGFDTYFGLLQGVMDYFTHQYDITDPGTGTVYSGLDVWNNGTPDSSRVGEYSSIVFADEAVRIINEKDENSPPMYMHVALQNGHDPYQIPESYTERYGHIDNKDRRALAGQITMLDEAVANITDALKSSGLWENTIFIYSCDHGAPTQAQGRVGTNYPLRGVKGTLWDGGIKVAGFISGPKAPRHNTVYNGLMHISDWYPTLLHAAGINIPYGLDGVNQWKALQGRIGSPRNEVLYNIDPLSTKYGVMKEGSPFDNRIQAGLRIGDMKLLTGDTRKGGWYPPVSTEAMQTEGLEANLLAEQILNNMDPKDVQNIFLFNITADPCETTDLSQKLPGIVDEMLARLAQFAKGAALPSNVPLQYEDADPGLRGDVWWPWQDMEGNPINLVDSSQVGHDDHFEF